MKYFNLIIIFSCFFSCKTEPLFLDPTTDPNQSDLFCPDGVVSFVNEIKPLINAGCATSGCHDANSAQDGVVLDTYENILKEITPYKPNNSELYESLLESGDEIMPPSPNPAFTSTQMQLIETWILKGAKKTVCQADNCVEGGSSYSEHIYPLMQNKCIGCHNDGSTSGGVNLVSHGLIVGAVTYSNLVNCVKGVDGFSIMPPSNVLSECEISQIEKWIDEGMQDN